MNHEVRGVVQGGVDTHADEFLSAETAGEDQPEITYAGTGGRTGGAPPGMTADEVEERSNLGRFIPMASLPGDKETLIAGARDMNAPDKVLGQLSQLPDGETYDNVSQIWEALGHSNEDITHRT